MSLRITGARKYALEMSTNKSFRGSLPWTRRVATSVLSVLRGCCLHADAVALEQHTRIDILSSFHRFC